METQNKPRLAIVQVSCDHHCYAIVTVAGYDVWGNAEDGWEVNNVYRYDEQHRIRASMTLYNAPRRPGVRDRFRTFGADSANVKLDGTGAFVDFSPDNDALLALVAEQCGVDVADIDDNPDGDDMAMYFERTDGYPLCEVNIIGWSDVEYACGSGDDDDSTTMIA